MGIQDQFTHCVRHEEARIAPHSDQLANLGGGDLQLGHRMDIDAACTCFVQIPDSAVPRSTSSSPNGPIPGARQPGRWATTKWATAAVRAIDAISAGSERRPFRRSSKGFGPDTHAATRPGSPRNTTGLLAHLAVVDHESRLAGRRELHHLQPQLRVGERSIAVRRIAGGEKADFFNRSACCNSNAVRKCA